MITVIIFVVIAYLIGSLSSAILICKFLGLPDPRTEGSGNPGATNVLRVGGKTAALMTLVGDILKGFIPVFLCKAFGIQGAMLVLIGIAAIIGHIFPVFFKFKGGKGVATALGVFLGLSFIMGGLALITWLVVAGIFRYSSLAALATVILTPFFALFTGNFSYFIPTVLIAVILILTHLNNIKRLRAGTEGKISF